MLLLFLVVPRILFEHWSIDDIIRIYSNTESQTQLIVSLLDTAKVYTLIIFLYNVYIIVHMYIILYSSLKYDT